MVSHCAGPTRGVCDRALHEHRRASRLPSHIPFLFKNQPGFIPD